MGYHEGRSVKLKQAKKDLDSLLITMQYSEVFKDLNDYVTSIDFTTYTGFTIRLLLVMGGKRCNPVIDSYYSRSIGEFWSGCIARGNGSRWAVTYKDEQYEKLYKLSIDTIKIREFSVYSDAKSREPITFAIEEWCKKRDFAKLRMNLNPKTKRLHKGTSIRHGAVRGIKRKSVLASD